MARRTISKDELEADLENRVDPIRELPAGFPSMHSRFPAIPSQAFVDDASASAEAMSSIAESDIDEARTAIRSRLRAIFPSRS